MVAYYSSDYDVKCQLDTCKTYPVITDSDRGEVFCGGCGLVIVQNLDDTSNENRSYSSEEFMKNARTGPATSLTMFDRGLSTVIGTTKILLEIVYQVKQNMNLIDFVLGIKEVNQELLHH